MNAFHVVVGQLGVCSIPGAKWYNMMRKRAPYYQDDFHFVWDPFNILEARDMLYRAMHFAYIMMPPSLDWVARGLRGYTHAELDEFTSFLGEDGR